MVANKKAMRNHKFSIRTLIKDTVLRLPNGNEILAKMVVYRDRLYPPMLYPVYRKRLFTDYYRNNFWKNTESVSGDGSTLEYTKGIRKEIPGLVENYNIKIFLDAPCGDYNWFQKMEMPDGMEYIGGDIVEALIKNNQKMYGNQHKKFITIDIVKDKLPKADLWLCRDCLFHFSNDDIFKTLSNFLRSEIKYILTSVYTDSTMNKDTRTGVWQKLNLELPPFNFCKPILYIDDWIPGCRVRKLGLWTKSMVADSVFTNPEIQKYL